MQLDIEIKRTMIQSSKDYLSQASIPYRSIVIRRGIPVVIVDAETFEEILDRKMDGYYMAQSERGWSAYKKSDNELYPQYRENMTEYQASCWITDTEFGRKPKLTRYSMGGAIS